MIRSPSHPPFLGLWPLLSLLMSPLPAAELVGRFASLGLPLLAADSGSAPDREEEPPLVAPPTAVAEAGAPRQTGFLRRIPVDLWDVVSSPARWDRRDWVIAGACVAGTVATGLLVDRTFQDESQENRTSAGDRWSGAFGQLGTIYSLAALGGAGAYGWFADDPKGVEAMLDGLETTVIASGIITPALKLAVGRSRPNKTAQDTDVFQPFSGEQSFPSGHTTQAFGVASVLAWSYPDQPVIGALAFTVAAGVGLSRINDDNHYASDVVAGALIGTYVGYRVVKANRQRRTGGRDSAMIPDLDLHFASGPAMELNWRW